MKKNMKKIKNCVILLLAILLTLIAFFGVFKFDKGVWNNLIPTYKYGMDIVGSREIRYEVDESEKEKYVYVDENGNIKGEVWKDGSSVTAESEATSTEDGQATESAEEISYSKETRTIKTNSDDVLTQENLEKVKKIIQKRLEEQNISEYSIRIDDVTGKLVVETANNNDDVETVESLLNQAGNFKIVDYQNGLELMNNSDIKDVSVIYSNNSSYSTYLQIQFNKDGAEKLRDMSKKYVEIKNEKEENKEEIEETTENQEENSETEEANEEETTKKYVSIVLDDSTLMTTYFGEEMTQGILQIQIGDATTETDKFIENQKKASRIATVLNSGIFPVKYNIETDNFVKSEVNDNVKNTIKMAFCAIILIASIVLLVRFKEKGLIISILSIGFVSVFSLAIRYTNVSITLNSIISSYLIVIMNYILMFVLLKENENEKISTAFSNAFKKFYLRTIPVCVIALVFTFATSLQISSIGMVLFWGMILIAIYNTIFTKNVLK